MNCAGPSVTAETSNESPVRVRSPPSEGDGTPTALSLTVTSQKSPHPLTYRLLMDTGTDIDDQLLSFAFSLHSSPRSYALLLGAGVSIPSGISGAWDVLMELVKRVAVIRGDPEPEQPDRWYINAFGESPRYDSVLEKIAPTPQERQQLLRGFFEPTADDFDNGRKSPTVAHRSIARLVKASAVRVIITLNFDHLIETALREEGIHPTIVSTAAQMAGIAPLHTLECCLVHLHGDYLEPTSMLNTGAELASYDHQVKDLMARVLSDYGLIAAGWSATWDPALRELIDEFYPNRYTFGWIEPSPLSDLAEGLRLRKTGTLIPTTAEFAFGRLADAVDALHARRSRHPLTVAVAAATAKRELAGATIAVNLHDTLRTEMDRLHRIDDFNLPDYQSDAPYGGYEQMRSRVEEASAVTCSLVAVLAHWGSPDTDRWWISEISRFASWELRDGGLTKLLELPAITGTALFCSAGVAATAAQRWDLIAQLFRTTRRTSSRSAEPLVNLGADRLPGNNTRCYQMLYPTLYQALSLGHAPLDDAWQTFEILRLVEVLLHATPGFNAVATAFTQADEAAQAADQKHAAGAVDQEARNAAWEARGRSLGQAADLVHVGAPHIFTSMFDPETRAFTAPVVTRLQHHQLIDDNDHPLVAALRTDFHSLRTATQAVAVALGRAGNQAPYRRAAGAPMPGAFVIPDSVWLDTERPTPVEVRTPDAS